MFIAVPHILISYIKASSLIFYTYLIRNYNTASNKTQSNLCRISFALADYTEAVGKRFEKNCNMMLSGSHFSIDGCVSLIIDCLKEKETPENE